MVKRIAARCWSTRGFGLIDQLATVAVVATVCAIAVPAITSSIDGQRLGIDVRAVEREVQLARLTAVSTNRPMRVRFNCPDAGSYRRVELIGSVNNPSQGDDADTQAVGIHRCSTLYYPFPAADKDPLTRPNNDGPLLKLNSKVTFTSVQTLEFWPNGTVHYYDPAASQWKAIGTTPVNLILSKGSTTRAIVVNGLGKIQFQ